MSNDDRDDDLVTWPKVVGTIAGFIFLLLLCYGDRILDLLGA